MKSFLLLGLCVSGVLLAHRGLLAANPTAQRSSMVQERILPVTMEEKGPGWYFFAFEKEWFAGLEIEINQPEAGRILVVHMGETLSDPHSVNRKAKGDIRYWQTYITLSADKKTYVIPLRSSDARGYSKEIGPVMPFRYVEIEGAPPLKREQVRQIAAHYPFNDNAADFKCSDPKVNAVYDMCKHTMKAVSFMDGDRERMNYEGDAYINMLGWYACTDDLTLPRFAHEALIGRPIWPTEWIMFSVFMGWEDYRHTGDPTSLKAFYPELTAKALMPLRRADGLISTVNPPFKNEGKDNWCRGAEFKKYVGNAIHLSEMKDLVDWEPTERDAYEMLPINTVVNAFHVRALQYMAKIAAVLQKPEDEKMFNDAAALTLESLNTKLIDSETGLYVDGEGSKHSSLQGNMFPLAFGLVPPARREKVTAFIKSRGMKCSTYGAQFLMEALFDQNEAEYALSLMTADTDRSWSHMLAIGASMTFEMWDPKFSKYGDDMNHPWSTGPANVLPRKVLGIEPLEPGFSKLSILPRLGKLQWAEGHVTSKCGRVSVRAERSGEGLNVTFEIPNAVTARVGLLKSEGSAILLDGKKVAAVETDGMLFLDGVAAGKHVVGQKR